MARKVERLVGSRFHRLFLASLSEIVPAWFVTFASSVVEVPLCARLPIYFLIQRQRSPAAPCAPYGGTPCWAVHLVFGCSALAHCSQCDSVVAFLCIVDVEGPVHVRQPVIHMPNVSVLRTAHFVRRTEQRLVGCGDLPAPFPTQSYTAGIRKEHW